MRTRRFGRLGWSISEIGYGAWQIGGNMWGEVGDRDAEAAIEAALEAGITFFDTALAYGRGRSEQVLGRVLKRTGMRERVYVATKVPPMDWEWPADHASKLQNIFPAHWIEQCTRESTEHLGFAPDIQQLHVWSDNWANDAEWSDALSALRERGVIKAFGVSINDHEPDTALKVVKSGKVDCVQVIYNVFDQTPETALFPACLEHDVAVIVRVPLDEGSLGGKLTKETKFAAEDVRARYFKGKRLAQAVDHVEKLRPVLENDEQTLAQGALRFCLSHKAVTTVIAGSTKPAHIRDNAAVSERGRLENEKIAELRAHAWARNFYNAS
ncbi:MAG TPA: aldo/keto reductase [Longimicrobiales bacterium]|nr:aldo/keto reductase [Longimicrobiales bacterium]